MTAIASSILEIIGETPLVRVNRLSQGLQAHIIVKIESLNPGGSVKDRIARNMLREASTRGLLKAGGTIVEPTSGNTGIGLAMASAVLGYRLILTMPETMSVERQKLLRAYGADIVLTPGDQGMAGAVCKAKEIAAEQGAYMPQQFENPANPAMHRRTTAQEIWRDTGEAVDVFVAGIGTGGTLIGVGAALKEAKPSVRVIGVEPATCAVIGGGKAGMHGIQGLGAGFVPAVYDPSVVDEVMSVEDEEAMMYARRLAREEGILSGISAGAAMAAALSYARREEAAGKMIVVLLPDSGERYLSTSLFAS